MNTNTPRRRQEDRNWWTRCRPWLAPLVIGTGLTLALIAFQEQTIRNCRQANQGRLVLRQIIQASYGDAAVHPERLPPGVTVREIIRQENRFLHLARDLSCPSILPF